LDILPANRHFTLCIRSLIDVQHDRFGSVLEISAFAGFAFSPWNPAGQPLLCLGKLIVPASAATRAVGKSAV
jgi:hypothetical protein